MKRVILSLAVVVGLVLFLRVNTGTAEARISWCDGDLAPMATIAEEANSPNAAGEALNFSVPSPAVSVEKGGTNAHK